MGMRRLYTSVASMKAAKESEMQGGGDVEAEAPANVVLDPRDEKARDDGAEVDAEVEPAEERRLALPVR